MEVLLYNNFDVQGHLFRVYWCANLLYYEKILYVIYFSKKLVKWCNIYWIYNKDDTISR